MPTKCRAFDIPSREMPTLPVLLLVHLELLRGLFSTTTKSADCPATKLNRSRREHHRGVVRRGQTESYVRSRNMWRTNHVFPTSFHFQILTVVPRCSGIWYLVELCSGVVQGSVLLLYRLTATHNDVVGIRFQLLSLWGPCGIACQSGDSLRERICSEWARRSRASPCSACLRFLSRARVGNSEGRRRVLKCGPRPGSLYPVVLRLPRIRQPSSLRLGGRGPPARHVLLGSCRECVLHTEVGSPPRPAHLGVPHETWRGAFARCRSIALPFGIIQHIWRGVAIRLLKLVNTWCTIPIIPYDHTRFVSRNGSLLLALLAHAGMQVTSGILGLLACLGWPR